MTTDEAIDGFRSTLLAMAEMGGDQGFDLKPRKWNQAAHQLQGYWLEVRRDPRALYSLVSLLDHPRPAVRVFTASYLLATHEPEARQVLTAMAEDHTVGVYAVDAKYALLSFDAGTLRTDWQPRRRR